MLYLVQHSQDLPGIGSVCLRLVGGVCNPDALKNGGLQIMKRKKIKATYRNGVIEPLDRIDLPEGQELEVEFSVLQKTPRELSREAKTELIQKMSGSMKGTWGSTVEEIDAYIKSERQSWDREF